MCIAHAGAHVFASAGQKCYRNTDTLLNVEVKKLANAMADKITQALFYAVADRLAEVEAKTIGDNTAQSENRRTTSCSG